MVDRYFIARKINSNMIQSNKGTKQNKSIDFNLMDAKQIELNCCELRDFVHTMWHCAAATQVHSSTKNMRAIETAIAFRGIYCGRIEKRYA